MNLYPHNQKAYDALVGMLEVRNRACVIQPCGTGKAIIAFHYAQEHPEERILWLSPNEYILAEQGENLRRENEAAALENVRYMTYAAAMVGAKTKTLDVAADTIIFDEFHRIGAPEWSKGVEEVVRQNPSAKLIGFTATEVRSSDNDRDMAEEFFHGNVASYMTLEEAWLMGILPIPKYVSALYDAPEELGHILARIDQIKDERRYGLFMSKYEKLRRAIAEADNLDVIFARHLEKRDAKIIVFCSSGEHLEDLASRRHDWFGKVNPSIHAYKTYEANPLGEKEYQAFKEDESSALKVLYCINQLNEGVHIEGVDGIVMVRPTLSPIIFRQQLGRALDVGGNGVPLVFDLVNNLGSAGAYIMRGPALEDAYRDLIKRGKQPPYSPKNFAVYDEIKDPREFLADIRTAIDVRMPVEARIERLERLYAAGESYEKTQNVIASLRNDYKKGRLTEEDVRRIEALGVSLEPKAGRRQIVCYETGEVFESIVDAARAVDVKSHGNIIKACKEKGVSAGFHWYYADEPRPDPSEFKTPQMRPVLCVETGEVFDDIASAVQDKGVSPSGISQALRTGRRAGAHHWRYVDSDEELPQKREHEINKCVICFETGEVFENAAAAARLMSVSAHSIYVAIDAGTTAGGCHWHYEDGPKPDPAKFGKRRHRMVLCIETGKTFKNCAEAAKALGLSRNAISNIISKEDRTAGGYHWRYATEEEIIQSIPRQKNA